MCLFVYSYNDSIQGQNDDQPISIMAIARDSAAASSVMGNIGRVAKRYKHMINIIIILNAYIFILLRFMREIETKLYKPVRLLAGSFA